MTITIDEINTPLTDEQKEELHIASEKTAALEKAHPILEQSPLSLRMTSTLIDDYLKAYSLEEQDLWKSYYSDEL